MASGSIIGSRPGWVRWLEAFDHDAGAGGVGDDGDAALSDGRRTVEFSIFLFLNSRIDWPHEQS